MDIRDLSKTSNENNSDELLVDPPKRRWLTRVALPLLILLLSGGLLAYAARDLIWPLKHVRVVRVLATKSSQHSSVPSTGGTAIVSVLAPGWVEPDPYPIYVTALTSGIIEKVLVLEGQHVEAGQVVAEMVEDDARLAASRAKAELARRKAFLKAAQSDWNNPVLLTRTVTVNQSLLAEATAQLAQLDAVIAQEKGRLSELQVAYNRLSKLQPRAATKLEVEQAKYQVDAQRSQVEATKMQQPVIEARIRRYEAEVKAAEANLRLRIALRMALDEAKASVNEGAAALEEARLRQARMKVVSPVAGIVMQRLVAPGAKVMLGMDDKHSAHVLHVYRPKNLQVRVDVPIGDAAKVGMGQEVEIVVDVLPNRQFAGRVSRFVHQADISKNTIEVKVSIEGPSSLLKPDMLARVKFLTSQLPVQAGTDVSSALTVYAPRQAVQDEGGNSYVWVVTPGELRLRRQIVKIGVGRGDDWVEVTDGLHPGDVLVSEPSADLQQGQRISMPDDEKNI